MDIIKIKTIIVIAIRMKNGAMQPHLRSSAGSFSESSTAVIPTTGVNRADNRNDHPNPMVLRLPRIPISALSRESVPMAPMIIKSSVMIFRIFVVRFRKASLPRLRRHLEILQYPESELQVSYRKVSVLRTICRVPRNP